MFGKQEETGGARSQSLIQEGMSVRGEIRVESDIRLEGSLEGSIVSKSRVIIGASGVVQADVEAGEILVMGRVTGKLTAHRRIELRKGAHVEGDISTQSLVIEDGVFFQGLSQMNLPAEQGGGGMKGREIPSGDGGGGRRPDKEFLPAGSARPST